MASRLSQNLLVRSKIYASKPSRPKYLVKHPSYVISRHHSDKCHCKDEQKEAAELSKKCPNKTCPKKKKKKGFFARLFGEEEKKYPKEMCRLRYKDYNKPDPDLSSFGGTAFKTCGRGAYIIQKDNLPVDEDFTSKEDLLIRKIEAPLGNKHEIVDPMPSFRSVEQRLLDLQERKLHPFYKRFQGLSKKPPTPAQKELYQKYTNISLEKIAAEEVPKKIKFNRDLLEKKNLYSEFKRVEPPIQIVARLLEMKMNQKLSLDGRAHPKQICREEPEPVKKTQVFDTLQQKGDLF